MENYIQFIYKAWKQFTDDNYINPAVRPEIADSWRRCKNYGVDYMSGRGNDLYKVPVELKIKENSELISVAHPIMEDLYNIVAGSGFAIILTDKDGYLIDVISDDDIMDRADDLNFVLGSLWTEKAVGTNAIGTALYLDKPIQTIGAEHYGINQHSWTCSATPIHDEKGNTIGCLNMSGSYYNAHPHTLAIVTAAAQSVQKQLALMLSNKLMNITFNSISEGMIVIDENLNINSINHMAENILGITQDNTFNININEILRNINFGEICKSHKAYNNIDCDFYINNKRIKCIINAVPMKVNGKLSGIVITFREAQYVHKLVNKVIGFKASYRFEDIITQNEKMEAVINFAKKAAQSDCNILIEGKSGTGKELIAQSIHNYSKRADGPFIAVNCASIPRELVESELFGYDKGAFTGASKEGHPGKFELADGGTIFLDEIGELPLDIQSKLLRVLDNNKITRVGGEYEKELNVRVIGATNRNLKEEIRKKNFREDLYYRLNVMNIKTVPLSERKEDIEALASYFVERLNIKNDFEGKTISKSYIKKLSQYDWPGNVRELRNVVERDYYLCEGNIMSDDYTQEVQLCDTCEINKENVIPMNAIEKKAIQKALESCKGNIVQAAKLLKISRATMYRKIKKYNINNLLAKDVSLCE